MKFSTLLLSAVLSLGSVNSFAESPATALPTDTRLVVFSYDENNTYQILTRPKFVTNITLEPGEKFVTIALGDSVRWDAAKIDGNVFVRPRFENTITSATLVTDRRTYQMLLKSTKEDGKWYQRVSWEYPSIITNDPFSNKGISNQPVYSPPVEPASPSSQVALSRIQDQDPPEYGTQSSRQVSIDSLNFDYKIEGEAPFRPLQVFDSAKFTYIKFPKGLQDLPAAFSTSYDNKTELVNYTVNGDHIVVQKVAKSILLRLGKQQITITNNSFGSNAVSKPTTSRSFFGD